MPTSNPTITLASLAASLYSHRDATLTVGMQSKAMQSKAMQSKAMQSKAKQSKAMQSKAMQSKAMQSNAVQCCSDSKPAHSHTVEHLPLLLVLGRARQVVNVPYSCRFEFSHLHVRDISNTYATDVAQLPLQSCNLHRACKHTTAQQDATTYLNMRINSSWVLLRNRSEPWR